MIEQKYDLKGFDAAKYIEYLCSISGGRRDLKAAKEMGQEVRKYLTSISSTKSWIDCLLDGNELNNYFNNLQKGREPLTAGTVSEKIRRLRLGVEYIDHLHDKNETTLKCTRILQHMGKWRRSLRKEIQHRKAEMRIRSKSEVGSATSPEGFLSSEKIKEDIKKALENSDNISPMQHKVIVAYIAANIIYKNAQRPGVVQHMQIGEFETREETDEGNFLIQVLHHKTSASSGEADLIVSAHTNELIEEYLGKIRNYMEPKAKYLKNNLFLTPSGNELTKISELIRYIANTYGFDVPNATLNRKVTATSAREHLSQHEALAVHKHMSHAPETSMRSNQFPDIQDSLETQRVINKLQRKKYFTKAEDEKILKEWPTDNKATPSLKTCRAITQKHHLQRTAKQIQDRWKTLVKQQR